jgi:hypothetical protein
MLVVETIAKITPGLFFARKAYQGSCVCRARWSGRSFARIRRSYKTKPVSAAISSDWSNGQAEGQLCKRELVKRPDVWSKKTRSKRALSAPRDEGHQKCVRPLFRANLGSVSMIIDNPSPSRLRRRDWRSRSVGRRAVAAAFRAALADVRHHPELRGTSLHEGSRGNCVAPNAHSLRLGLDDWTGIVRIAASAA